MKKISLIIPMVLFLTFISSLKAQELSQAQLNDIAAKMIPIYHILLLDDNPTTPPPPPMAETEPTLPFETNTTEPFITIKGQAGTTVLINGTEVGELNASGELSTTLSDLSEGENNISIVLKDTAGNESEALTGTVTVDTIAPAIPIVTNPNPMPSVVTNNQLDITITGEPESAVYVDGLPKGTIGANGILVLTLDLEEGPNTFDITLRDTVGNVSTVNTISSIDFQPPISAPTVKFIQDINPDDEKVTDGELAGSNTIDVKINMPNATIGDTLVYKDIYNTQTTVDINSSMRSDGYIIKLGSRILFNHYEICAHIAHNSITSAEVCDKAQYIGENANLNVEIITDLNNDGNVSIMERNNTSEINVTTLFNDLDDSKLYDLKLITINPNETVTLELNASTIANGYTHTFTVAGGNELFEVSAQLLLRGGANIGDPAEDNATIEKGYPIPPELIITEDINNDGTITFDELDGLIDVVGTLPASAQVGDVLLLTNEYSTSPIEIILTPSMIGLGTYTYYLTPESNNTYRPCVQLRNNIGNLSPKVCDEAKLAPYNHLWIYSSEYNAVEGDADNNSSTFIHIIPTHLEEDDNVTINIDMPDDIELNMILEYSINNGTMTTIEINQTVIDSGQLQFTIDPTLNEVYTIFAKIERPLTHTKQYVGTYKFKVVDKEPSSAPIVEIIEDKDDDGIIESGNELNGTVDVNISLPADAHVGDTLKITDTSGMVTNVEINQSMLDNGYLVGYTPVLENIYNITASIIDASGNESLEGNDWAQLIDTYAGAPGIVFPQDTNEDGHLSASELSQATTVQVKFVFADDTRAGDTIWIQDPNQIVYQKTVITAAMMNNGYIIKEYGIQGNNQTYRLKAYIRDSAVDPQNFSETTEETIVVD